MDTQAATVLSRAVTALLAAGLVQDAATAHCLASTLGPLPPEVLAARLGTADDLEAAPLRELLLFPGRDTALALEPALTAAELDAAGQATLVAGLSGEVRVIRLLLPQAPPLELAVGPADLGRFVDRLRPSHTPPRAIRQVLAERFPPPTDLELAVDCRLAALTWSAPRRSFVETLLRRLDPSAADTPPAVRFALGFLAELTPDTPPLAALPRRRAALSAQLRQARRQEDALAASNFETLLLTGARFPHLHGPDIARDLALLDAIALALTGRLGASGGPEPRDLGTVADAEGLFQALGRLDDTA
jgi:hypothetical protein